MSYIQLVPVSKGEKLGFRSNDQQADFFIKNCIEKDVQIVTLKICDTRKIEQHKAFWKMVDLCIEHSTEDVLRLHLDLDAIDLSISESALKTIVKDALLLKTGNVELRMVKNKLQYRGQEVEQTVMMPSAKSIAFENMGQKAFYSLYQDCSALVYDMMREQNMSEQQIDAIFGKILKM